MARTSSKLSYLNNQILFSGFNFIVLFFATRNLSLQDFGEFSYAYSFIPLLNIPLLVFVNLPILNFYSKWAKINKEDNYLSNNLLICLSISIITSLILYFILVKTKTLESNVFYFVSFFLIYQIYDFIRRVYIVKNRTKASNFFEIIKIFSLIFLVTCLGYYSLWGVLSFIMGLIFILVISNSLYFIFSKIKVFLFNDFKLICEESFSFGKWIFLSNAIQTLSSNMYVYIGGIMLTSESIARLNAPKIFLGLTTIFLLAMDNYYTPLISHKFHEKKISFKSQLQLIFKDIKVLVLLYPLVSIILIFFQDNIVSFLFGSDYAQENFLWGFLVIGFLYLLTRPFIILLRVFNKTKFIFQSSVIVFAIVSLITYPLISNFDTFGALCIGLIGGFLQLLLFFIYSLNHYEKLHSR